MRCNHGRSYALKHCTHVQATNKMLYHGQLLTIETHIYMEEINYLSLSGFALNARLAS